MDKDKVIKLIKQTISELSATDMGIICTQSTLEAVLEELQKPDWISVEDELPPCDEEVFVANIANPKGVWRTYRTKEECPEKDKNDFSCPRGFTITHWISIKLEV